MEIITRHPGNKIEFIIKRIFPVSLSTNRNTHSMVILCCCPINKDITHQVAFFDWAVTLENNIIMYYPAMAHM